MTISLVVEDGSAATNSNVYASITFVDQYCENMGYTAWASLASTVKKPAMMRAMTAIERSNFKGLKLTANQALEWPREGVYDWNGYYVSSSSIPTGLKNAFAEASYRESQSAGCLLPSLTRGGKIKKKKIDIIETEWFPNAPTGTTYPLIATHLKGLIRSLGSFEMVRSW